MKILSTTFSLLQFMPSQRIIALVIGISLLLGGLGLSLYKDPRAVTVSTLYPYQTIGIILLVAGLAFMFLGLFTKLGGKSS